MIIACKQSAVGISLARLIPRAVLQNFFILYILKLEVSVLEAWWLAKIEALNEPQAF